MATLTAQSKQERPLLRLLSTILTKAHRITLWLIIASILGVLALPLLDRSIRFDEKGLLAGLAHATVSQTINAVVDDIHRISRTAAGTAFKRPGAAAALAAELRRAGLTETQLTRPTVFTAGGASCRCANVHTRIRAPRGDGLESLALVTPLAFSHQRQDPVHGGCNQTADGAQMALMAAAALALHMARGHVAGAAATASGGGRWLVRDLLWVVPDLSCGRYQCLEAWVRQYYEDVTQTPARSPAGSGKGDGGAAAAAAAAAGGRQSAAGLYPGQGQGNPDGESRKGTKAVAPMIRAGVIQQAVVLEALAGASYDTSELLVVGHNGLLPKLDMYYLLRYMFNYPQTSSALWGSDRLTGPQRALATWLERVMPEGLLTPHALRNYAQRLLTGLQFSWHQAVGLPSASHAAFKDFMVDAATVRLVQRDAPASSSVGRVDEQQLHHRAMVLSSSLELTLRSLNNLVERVHHSSFLYVLTDNDRYVSVERYVLPAVLLVAAIQLQAAWSMAAVQRLLGTTPSAAPKPPTSAATSAPSCLSTALSSSQSCIWAVAAARAAARAAVLAALASGLRALAWDLPRLGWLLQRVLQGGFGCDAMAAAGSAAGRTCGGVAEVLAAAVATIQSLLRQPLTTPGGLLAAAAVLVGAAAAAAIAASMCGRLAGAASMRGTSNWDVNAEGTAGWRKQERPGADTGEGAPSSSSPPSASPSASPSMPLPASSSCASGIRKVSASKEGQVEGNITSDIINGVVSEHGDTRDAAAAAAHMAAAASWHAERVLVLTTAATAMTALVCLNWAAAVVVGIYLAPLALWQGLTVRQALGGGGSSARRRWAGPPGVWLRLLKAVVWVFWNPLIFLVLFYAAAAAAGIAAGGLSSAFSGSMMQLAVHGMSTVNYWFMSVVVMLVWLFGIG